ncbi:MAG: thioredoxin domain-containing protein, partial [bacterium]|nr:thioredoxin domain-containing protein [bacterium]
MFFGRSGFVAHAASQKPLPSPQTIRQLPPDGGPQFNRLIFETSPYLQQHATNPIDWYAWGEAALAKARREDKPIFLSIGYSTCHWCHVMERESYANAEVGRLMNQFFVAIKVDREERPDLDHLYMNVCHRMSQHCGWPLNIVLTPDQKPFFAGTYFPREDRHGRPGMLRLLPSLDQVWKTRRKDIDRLSERVVAALKQSTVTTPGGVLELSTLHHTYDQLSKLYDGKYGGIGGPPKFPKPMSLGFLLRYWQRTGKTHALEMVETTLQGMRRGGIYDHIGFGFHRYATDAQWLVPHFEKMLYNQALLLMVYTDAYQITGKSLYAQTAREIATYVLRDMTSSEGGFYSAQDADSEGEEGLFYHWTQQDILKLLNADDAALYAQVFNIKPNGNFREGAAKKLNIPYLKQEINAFASQLQTTEVELRRRLERARQRLFVARKQRVHPFKDDKILTDWNGLMIAALSKAGQALNEPAYIVAAQRAADFVLWRLRDAKGRLLKRSRGSKAGLAAQIDDYAYLIWG